MTPHTSGKDMLFPDSAPERTSLDALRNLPITIDGVQFAGGTLHAFAESHAKREGFWGDLGRFLMEWRQPLPTMTVLSSGSTGAPKALQVEKERMAASARATCDFLRLGRGDTALLAMPLRYIAARMVVVRALVAGLNLLPVQPTSSPLKDVDKEVAFAPLTPMQAFESLQDAETARRLRRVRCLLLGGGAITARLAEKLADFPNEVWSSYGMTETLSHIALRRLNGPEASEWYTPLPGVGVRLTPEGTLAIWAPRVADGELVTHDLAELDEAGRFRILGRCDNVVNTGGIKVQLEAVEELLEPVLRMDFCVTSVPDQRLGEKLVLLYGKADPVQITGHALNHAGQASARQGAGQASDMQARLETLCRHVLPRYWVPRVYLPVPAIPLTDTGKKARLTARELALRLVRNR